MPKENVLKNESNLSLVQGESNLSLDIILSDPTETNHIVNKKYVDDKLDLKVDKTELEKKQDKLIAGEGININSDQTISVVNPSPFINEDNSWNYNGGESLNFKGVELLEISTPSASSSAAPKEYIDNKIAALEAKIKILENNTFIKERIIPTRYSVKTMPVGWVIYVSASQPYYGTNILSQYRDNSLGIENVNIHAGTDNSGRVQVTKQGNAEHDFYELTVYDRDNQSHEFYFDANTFWEYNLSTYNKIISLNMTPFEAYTKFIETVKISPEIDLPGDVWFKKWLDDETIKNTKNFNLKK